MNKMDYKNRLSKAHNEIVSNPVAKQIMGQGKARPLSGVDVRDMYTKLFVDVPDPIHTDFMSSTDKVFSVEKFCASLGEEWQELRRIKTYVYESKSFKDSVIVFAKDPGYLIFIQVSYPKNKNKTDYDESGRVVETPMGDYIYSSLDGKIGVMNFISVYHPNYWDDRFSMNELDTLAKYFNDSCIEKFNDSSIGMISSSENAFYVKDFSLSGKTPEFKFPDLHYGEGFEDFHKELLERISTQTKGLVLLHGDPGTGKTQYIRVLLKELASLNKSVLYIPPSLSSILTDPNMIEFISSWILESERDCILLIEDAEPLLEVRNSGDGRTTGISNLLNITDGLLNDILGLMVIATFNTEISKIDPALLRPQRLLARKVFKKISKENAENLAKALEIETPNIKYPASLADFYSHNKNRTVLLHDLSEEKKTIGFNR
jgi:hypothetical protein